MIGKRGFSIKLKKKHFGKKFFTIRVVRHWNRVPSKVVHAASLEMFKAKFDVALSIIFMVKWKVSLSMADGMG